MLDKLQFNKNLILFYKYDKNSRNLLFINKYQQKYKTLSGKNYALALSILNSHDRSWISFLKNNYNEIDSNSFKKNYNTYNYWNDNAFSNYWNYQYLYYTHFSITLLRKL